MQYQTHTDGEVLEYSDGVAVWRNGSIDNSFVLDKKLTALGFDGVEGVDYKRLYALSKIGLTGIFRNGVRENDFVLDETITPLGFGGVESVDEGVTGDWIEVYIFE